MVSIYNKADRCKDIATDRADWLLDAVACATQDRRFLRGDPAYDEYAGEAILLNGAKAIQVSIARFADVEDDVLIDKIASALWMVSQDWDSKEAWSGLPDYGRDFWRDRARAAVLSMHQT